MAQNAGICYALSCIAEECFLNGDKAGGRLAEKLAHAQCTDLEVYAEWKEVSDNRPKAFEWRDAWQVFQSAQR